MTTATETVRLSDLEAAYARLASFQRGDRVILDGRPGCVVVYPQQPGRTMDEAYLLVTGYGTETYVTVRSLLSGRHAITSLDDAKAGNVRYFDAAGYATQNPEG